MNALFLPFVQNVNVSVTKDDIDKSRAILTESTRCETCPIAIALQRISKRKCTVGANLIFIEGWFVPVFKLPAEALEFMRKVDSNQEVEPISFILSRQ